VSEFACELLEWKHFMRDADCLLGVNFLKLHFIVLTAYSSHEIQNGQRHC